MSHLSFALRKQLVRDHGWEFFRQVRLPELADDHRALHGHQDGGFWAGYPHPAGSDPQPTQ